MTASEFIDALEAKELLPNSAIEKLRKKVAASDKPLTAKSLARFLIDKGHLSKPDAMAALAAGGEIKPPLEPEPSSTGEPSGVDLPMDELQDLSSSAEWSMEESSSAFAEPAAGEAIAEPSSGKKKKKKKVKKGNEWDSPLLLIGGGALVLMSVVAVLIWYIMFYENADNVLSAARTEMEAGSYGNAIANYEKFVENYPGNAEFSKARVELAMARIRQSLETGNESRAFDTMETEVNAIGGEPDFNVAEEDLSDLLPRIARGLADEAEASTDLSATEELSAKATTALGMANNTKYIPKSRRDNTELEEIRETLDRIDRRQQSLTDLDETLASIESNIAQGETAAAFADQEQLVAKHPALIGDERLSEALKKISAAEQQGIRYVEEPIEAATAEPDSPIVATLTVANRRVEGEAPTNGVFCVQVDSVAYGVDAATGSVVWRRYTGPAIKPVAPFIVDGDVVLVEWRPAEGDKQQQSLARVEAATGKLQWRLTLDDDFADPVVSEDALLLAGASGKLHVVDIESGTRRGYVQFAQPLVAPPVLSPQSGTLYIPGERSSVYTLKMDDYSCVGVHYTNHPRQSIVAQPALVLDKLVLVENDGAKTSRVKLYGLGEQGAVAEVLAEQRLEGRVVSQPLVEGRRFTLLTDRGQVGVFEVSVGSEGDPLTVVATRPERNAQPFMRYGKISDGHIWLAENALTKYAVAPTGNRLTVVPLTDDYNQSQFVGPIDFRDGVLFHTRARRQRAGFTITACNAKDAKPFWETDIAAPPADTPLASTSPVALIAADANGRVYRFDPKAIKTRAQNNALTSSGRDNVIYEYSELLAGGNAVFASDGAEQVLLYSPSAQNPLSDVSLASKLACRPMALGEAWIAPLSVGQVFVLDAKNGRPLAAPFQPPLEAGKTIAWRAPFAIDDERFVITDGVAKVYILELQASGEASIVVNAQADLSAAPLASGFLALKSVAVALAESGQIVVHQLPGLEVGESMNPGGRVTWGPYQVGQTAVFATSGKLFLLDGDGKEAWNVPLTTAKFAGPPMLDDESMLLASEDGVIVRIALGDGSEVGRVDVGEPLASGPVLLNNRCVVAGRDASLLVIESP